MRARSSFASMAWLLAGLMLVQAVLPAIASAAARWQGQPLVEVCTLYGVKTVQADASPAADAELPANGNTAWAQHPCALAALGGASPAPALPAFSLRQDPAPHPGPQHAVAVRDRQGEWMAGHQQGPPRG